jgi:hypothetical protein
MDDGGSRAPLMKQKDQMLPSYGSEWSNFESTTLNLIAKFTSSSNSISKNGSVVPTIMDHQPKGSRTKP